VRVIALLAVISVLLWTLVAASAAAAIEHFDAVSATLHVVLACLIAVGAAAATRELGCAIQDLRPPRGRRR